jgi:hypothetical protein
VGQVDHADDRAAVPTADEERMVAGRAHPFEPGEELRRRVRRARPRAVQGPAAPRRGDEGGCVLGDRRADADARHGALSAAADADRAAPGSQHGRTAPRWPRSLAARLLAQLQEHRIAVLLEDGERRGVPLPGDVAGDRLDVGLDRHPRLFRIGAQERLAGGELVPVRREPGANAGRTAPEARNARGAGAAFLGSTCESR